MTRVQLDGYLDAVAQLRNPSRRSTRVRRGRVGGTRPAQDATTTHFVSLRRRTPKSKR